MDPHQRSFYEFMLVHCLPIRLWSGFLGIPLLYISEILQWWKSRKRLKSDWSVFSRKILVSLKIGKKSFRKFYHYFLLEKNDLPFLQIPYVEKVCFASFKPKCSFPIRSRICNQQYHLGHSANILDLFAWR